MAFLKVRLLGVPSFLDTVYDYHLPEGMEGTVSRGTFVELPFGTRNRLAIGLVVRVTDTTDCAVTPKDILCPHSTAFHFSEEQVLLVEYLCEHTLCTTEDAVHTLLPPRAIGRLSQRISLTPLSTTEKLTGCAHDVYLHLLTHGPTSLEALLGRFGAETHTALARLSRECLIKREEVVKKGTEGAVVTTLSVCSPLPDPLPRLGTKQKALLELLRAGEKTDAELRAAGFALSHWRALMEKGLVKSHTEEVLSDNTLHEILPSPPLDYPLSDEQAAAVARLRELGADGEAHAVLLHGVTGSGKTYVMLKAIDDVLDKRKSVIVLLPEIALTPQTLSIFSSRYGACVTVMHSGLSVTERVSSYLRVLRGDAKVIVGTRSAVFAPAKDLGLIVIDEEHEHTYKSDMDPKYHARDVARFRAAYHKAVLLLASATPSVESFQRAREGRYTLLSLKTRPAGAVLPEVTVADMRPEAAMGNASPFGEVLREALKKNVEEKHQAILFLNRRGYNHTVSCRSCGGAVTCPRCSVSMTYHVTGRQREGDMMICHMCGLRMAPPQECPSCHSPHLMRLGYGIQRVEEEIGTQCPTARVLRMDSDTTSTKGAYNRLLGTFREGGADVLLGTQMVTKGHDFPRVTLVGALMADMSLYLDDYRAAEHTFATLTQVVGRAGRGGERGHAVIQTNNPDHEVIRLACQQDYEAFFEREIKLRRLLVFPPFCDIVLLTVSHTNEGVLKKGAAELARLLAELTKEEFAGVKLLAFGPFESPVYRVQNRFRMRMVVKCRLTRDTRALFRRILHHFGKNGSTLPLLSVDFNPSVL